MKVALHGFPDIAADAIERVALLVNAAACMAPSRSTSTCRSAINGTAEQSRPTTGIPGARCGLLERFQAHMLPNLFETPVGMKQGVPVLHAIGGDQHVDFLAHGTPPGAKRTAIASAGQRDVRAGHGLEYKRVHRVKRSANLEAGTKALQDLREDQIANHDGFDAENAVEK